MGGDVVTLFPVGWGFMLLHKYDGGLVVTDGGSHSRCIRKSLELLLPQNLSRPPQSWTWICSHLDYDHYSIVVYLIRERLWRHPNLVILPGVYSLKDCRITLAQHYMLSMILSYMMYNRKILIPSFSDLTSVLKGIPKLGVKQGDRLIAGRLVYHIIWPPPPAMLGRQCKHISKALENKIKEYKKKCEKHADSTACEEIFKKAKTEAAILEEIFSPTKTTGSKSELIEICIEQQLKDNKYFKSNNYENNKFYKKSDQNIITHKFIYEHAAKKFNDRELLTLHTQVINLFSLAYALLDPNKNLKFINISYIASKIQRHDWFFTSFLEENLLYSFSDQPLILYLSDLDRDKLGEAIDYYWKTIRLNPLIEIAPHHGNAYNHKLKQIKPKIIYISRCDSHVPRGYTKNFRYHYRLRYLKSEPLILYSDHSIKLTIFI